MGTLATKATYREYSRNSPSASKPTKPRGTGLLAAVRNS
jgi:hypothetical protein